ncbi:MAG: hypothetical protein IH957_05845 [Chloroflexi bacterium]|nr:hypothetical protein [Chloroflexota bacterium]
MTDHDLGTISSNGDISAVRLERDLDSIPREVLRGPSEPELRPIYTHPARPNEELKVITGRILATTAEPLSEEASHVR